MQNSSIKSSNSLGQSKWSLAEKMSFLAAPKGQSDYLSCYISLTLSESETQALLQNDGGIVDFWVGQKEMFPHLHAAALRILVTPASSSPIECDFSILKLTVTPRRNRVKEGIIDATSQVKSEYQNNC